MEVKCLACGGVCHEGFITDGIDFTALVSNWIEGRPTQNFVGGLKTGGLTRRPIQAYRCEVCGRLELYANPSASNTH